MNRPRLVELVSHQLEVHPNDVDAVLDAAIEVTITALANGETVTLTPFGAFTPHQRRPTVAYQARHEMTRIAEKIGVRFRPTESLKRRLNPGYRRRSK